MSGDHRMTTALVKSIESNISAARLAGGMSDRDIGAALAVVLARLASSEETIDTIAEVAKRALPKTR